MREQEVWYHPGWDRLYLVMINECGCCPMSYNLYWGDRFGECGAFIFEKYKEFEKWMKQNHRVKL